MAAIPVLPTARPVANPELLMVATAGEDEVHEEEAVTLAVEELL